MEGIRQWAFSICVALVVCGIAQMILPKNNLEKMFRLTVSVFFLCCLLSPVVLQNPQLRLELTEYSRDDMERRAQKLLEEVQNQSEQVVLYNVREIVEDKLNEMGINYADITININTKNQSSLEVDTVEVVLSREHEAQHHTIWTELEKSLGLAFRLGYTDMEKEGDEQVYAGLE